MRLDQVLANCAAMGVPPSEAKRLTLWEYTALLVQWNKAHATEEDDVPPAPVEYLMEMEQYFLDNPHLLN